MQNDTIAAIATPLAPGGLSVIRISGPAAIETAARVFRAASGEALDTLPGYTARFGRVFAAAGEERFGEPWAKQPENAAESDLTGGQEMQKTKPAKDSARAPANDEECLDEAVALLFRAPKSYTGEDVAELSCHGGVAVTRRVLRAVLAAGARLAEPGEFTKRAFLNGKKDLTRAEAVADLIGAQNEQARKAAAAAMEGKLFGQIEAVKAALLEVSAHFAAWADFPEEDVEALAADRLRDTLFCQQKALDGLIDGYDRQKRSRDGVETVIVGRPNVGKSTLMNLLAGQEKSIVTEIPGTTRDVVEETVDLGGVTLRLADTAGIRAGGDAVEQRGVEIAKKRLKTAQLALVLFDGARPFTEQDREMIGLAKGIPAVAVINKSDLSPVLEKDEIRGAFAQVAEISAKQGEGLDALKQAILQAAGLYGLDPGAAALANERQLGCAMQARARLGEALQALDAGMTLDAVTVSVQSALDALYALTGETADAQIIDAVFSRFCVGK